MSEAADQIEYDETVREIRKAIADMEAGRGRTVEEVDRSIREKLGFAPSS